VSLSEQPLFTEDQIRSRVAELAQSISRDHEGHELVMVVVLKGAAIFAADLVRELAIPVTVEYTRAVSYDGADSSASVRVTLLPETPLKGKHVLVVEDILDTGRTTAVLLAELQKGMPASLETCVLLDKPHRRVEPITPKYVGFTIDNVFVVGYGLDYNQFHRELRAIHTIDPH
jgi:hypoxanthine phosphoribosyltransferase